MKRYLYLLLVIVGLIGFTNSVFAKEPTLISFIYLNGSNDYTAVDRLKFEDHFKKQVSKMHPVMVKELEEDEFVQQKLLKNGEYKINPEPIVFYWGDRSVKEVQNIDNGLCRAKEYTPRIAQIVRNVFAHCLHDAIWVQKTQNMTPIVDDLQKVVMSEKQKGRKVILLGYSAGSFVTYNYFLSKFTSIIPKELHANTNNPDILKIVNDTPVNPTCLDALMELNLVNLDISGKFHTTNNVDLFRENYPKLDEKTKCCCFASDDVKGVVNFASPLLLFYSDATNSKSSLYFLSHLMSKHMIENDLFFLTINYKNDPLGFPSSNHSSFEELKNSSPIHPKNYKNGEGFIYNYSDVYVPRTFISAHLAYWDTPRRFVKAIVKSYNEGYYKFYGIEK